MDRVHRQQHVECPGRGALLTVHGRREDCRELVAQQPEPVEIVLRDRDSEEWASRHELAERLATAQRVSIGVADTGINQAHSQIGKGSQIHAGPYGQGSEPALAGSISQPGLRASGLAISLCGAFVVLPTAGVGRALTLKCLRPRLGSWRVPPSGWTRTS